MAKRTRRARPGRTNCCTCSSTKVTTRRGRSWCHGEATLRVAKRQAADTLLNYVSERRDMIRYPEFHRKGLADRQRPNRSDLQNAHGASERIGHALGRQQRRSHHGTGVIVTKRAVEDLLAKPFAQSRLSPPGTFARPSICRQSAEDFARTASGSACLALQRNRNEGRAWGSGRELGPLVPPLMTSRRGGYCACGHWRSALAYLRIPRFTAGPALGPCSVAPEQCVPGSFSAACGLRPRGLPAAWCPVPSGRHRVVPPHRIRYLLPAGGGCGR